MNKIALITLLNFPFSISYSQTKNFHIELRVPVQYENQKAEIPFSWGTETKTANAINFGIDGLMGIKKGNFIFNAGFGFFRNRINIKRGYDHQALNAGTDSLPVGTETKNYNYTMFRVPLRISYEVVQNKKMGLGIGAEHFFNFSFKRKYNGAVPFEGANTTYNGFNYFGNSLNFFITLSGISLKGKLSIEPFMRIYNKYKKDRFLKENENEHITRSFDAFGIGFRYTIIH